jgi:hypothetical protein
MASLSYPLISDYNLSTSSEPVVVLEAPAGPARSKWVGSRLAQIEKMGARTFSLSCDFYCGGHWAGMTGLFAELFSDIQSTRPDLIERHGLEVVDAPPLLLRNIHGSIDLLDEWKTSACPDASWVIVCDAFDKAGVMASIFFRELMRRSNRLRIRLFACVEPGNGLPTCHSFDSSIQTELFAPLLRPVAIEARSESDELER